MLIWAISAWAINAYTQRSAKPVFPEVGQLCPAFALHNIAYFSKPEATLADFKGKWLVLDFWNKNCGSCIESFPRTSEMQKRFSGDAQFMLVGIQDRENQIGPMYAAYREKEKLAMPCSFDSGLSNAWGIHSCPHLIIIGPDGVVKGVTNDLNVDQLKEFIAGGHPKLRRSYHTQNFEDPRDRKVIFDEKAPFMVDGNGSDCDTCYLFRSVFSKWQPDQKQYSPSVMDRNLYDPTYRGGRFQALGETLADLYLFAYFGTDGWGALDTMYGKYYKEPVLLVRDSSLFEPWTDGYEARNMFCYSVTIPPAHDSRLRMMEVMQNDLKSYFGFQVSIEERMFPCYRLVVANPDAAKKLATTGGPSVVKDVIRGVRVTMHNQEVQRLIRFVAGQARGFVLNETGISGNIDFTLDYIDFDEMMRGLHAYGLDLIKGEKMMKCLVIRDP